MRYFITGGAGFIGSNLARTLLKKGEKVTIYDNLSTGKIENIKNLSIYKQFKFIKGDVLNTQKLKNSMKNHDMVFHLQANADIRKGIKNRYRDIQQNIIGTYNVLESMKHSNIQKIGFSSSSAVYGEPNNFPTKETEFILQNSIYGASKLSAEGLIQAYSEYFGFKSWIFRFVSFIGKGYSHGVIFDFVKKLKKNPEHLEILGDGKQLKSFLDVQDGIKGMIASINYFSGNKSIINIGHNNCIQINELAEIVINEMRLNNIKFIYKGGPKGWKGDAPKVLLDINKIKKTGWKPRISIKNSIKRTVRYLLKKGEL